MDKSDKDQRLTNRVQVGDRMRLFADDPLIKGWFEAAIKQASDAMVEAAVNGDANAALHKGLTVNVLNEVRSFMLHAEAEGRRAGEELSKRNKEKVQS